MKVNSVWCQIKPKPFNLIVTQILTEKLTYIIYIYMIFNFRIQKIWSLEYTSWINCL